MPESVVQGIVSIGLAIIGVATIAVILSRNAATADVLKSAGSAFSTALGAATSPVSGGFGYRGSMM